MNEQGGTGRVWGNFGACPLSWAVHRVQGPPYRAIKAWPVLSHVRSCPQGGGRGLGQEGGRVNHCQPLPPTLPRMFHLINCEQKPKTLTRFYSYQSGEGQNISETKMSGEEAVQPHSCPHGLTGLSAACKKPSSWATPARDCCAPTPQSQSQ